MKKILLAALLCSLAVFLVFSGCSAPPPPSSSSENPSTQPWTPPASTFTTTPAVTATQPPIPSYPAPTATFAPTTTSATRQSQTYATTAPVPSTGNVGLAAGGAKDILNFRDNIHNGYLPLPTDITYEGLFYDYYFDTGATKPADKLFSPSYSFAVTRDPLSQQTEYYLSVGLNSGLKESDFQRKKLNLVIVLDTSGSMQENFNRYYYDRSGKQVDCYAEEGTSNLCKIDSAKQAVVNILNQLTSNDRFSIVLFNSNAFLAKPMGPVSLADMNSVINGVWNINAGGSTNLDAGIGLAMQQFRGQYEMNGYEYENRIIILTDAQPNTGDISSTGLMGDIARNANSRIYTTFIGIGVDFNTNLIEQISKTRGANYYSVHAPSEFRERIEDEFDYMVTPLVFDVSLTLASSGWKIDRVFGSPEANQTSGELMRINTLFPSKSIGGQTKGGLVLIKLRKTSLESGQSINLKVTYEDRNGQTDSSIATFSPETQQPEYFDNTGIRKGILLVRYASLLKNWMADERSHYHISPGWEPCISEATGIVIPPDNPGQWERTSLPLACSSTYKNLIQRFYDYFTVEANATGDQGLYQELTIMNTILSR